jgi:hypothetical protein
MCCQILKSGFRVLLEEFLAIRTLFVAALACQVGWLTVESSHSGSQAGPAEGRVREAAALTRVAAFTHLAPITA